MSTRARWALTVGLLALGLVAPAALEWLLWGAAAAVFVWLVSTG